MPPSIFQHWNVKDCLPAVQETSSRMTPSAKEAPACRLYVNTSPSGIGARPAHSFTQVVSLWIPIAWSHSDWIFTRRRKRVCNPYRIPLGSLWPRTSKYAFKYSRWILGKNASTYMVGQYTSERFVEWWRDHIPSPKRVEVTGRSPKIMGDLLTITTRFRYQTDNDFCFISLALGITKQAISVSMVKYKWHLLHDCPKIKTSQSNSNSNII